MKIMLTTKNLNIGKRVLLLVNNKIADELDKIFPASKTEFREAKLFIEKGPFWGYRVNLDLQLPHRIRFHAQEHGGNLLSAFTALREEIRRQVRLYHPLQ